MNIWHKLFWAAIGFWACCGIVAFVMGLGLMIQGKIGRWRIEAHRRRLGWK
jgi:hypothetical protein